LSKCLERAVNYSADIYEKLLTQENQEAKDLILKDLDRTIMVTKNENLLNNLISKKNILYNILMAYSNFDREVNYVQGNNYIANVLLSNLNSEKATFWIYVQIMEEKNWRDLFVEKLPKLNRLLDLFRKKLNEKEPEILEYFDSFEDEIFSAMFSHYFISIFSYNVPLEYANRIFDFFWLLEEKIILDSLIHLLNINKKKIMSMELEKLIPYIRGELVSDTINNYGIEQALPNL
jgi:hypothetical protein